MDINSIGASYMNSADAQPMPVPTFEMSPEEKARLGAEVDTINKATFKDGRKPKTELGKDDFLQLLIAQLSHQDPTAPMDNTQFIAQMAQFTSLEQLSNMNGSFTKLNEMLGESTAVSAVGRKVDIEVGSQIVSGHIAAATRGDVPQVQVNGRWYNWSAVKTIYSEN